MIENGTCHEVLQAVAEGIAEETDTECFVHDENRVELRIVGAHTVPLCLFTIDDDKGTFTLQMGRNGAWAEPYIVDLMEPDSIERLLLPTITMGLTMAKGFGRF